MNCAYCNSVCREFDRIAITYTSHLCFNHDDVYVLFFQGSITFLYKRFELSMSRFSNGVPYTVVFERSVPIKKNPIIPDDGSMRRLFDEFSINIGDCEQILLLEEDLKFTPESAKEYMDKIDRLKVFS